MVTLPVTLMSRVLLEKYGPRSGVWLGKHRNSSNISGFWRGLQSVKEIFWKGRLDTNNRRRQEELLTKIQS